MQKDGETILCRACHSTLDFVPALTVCPKCGEQGRLINNSALQSLDIAHVDCDAFYASVEQRDNPDLRRAPLIIGVDSPRSVVSTCCYKARAFGVRSAMSAVEAKKRCPHAVFVPPDLKRYKAVSDEIRALFDKLTPAVEPLSIDEAFLDMSGTRRLHGVAPAVMLSRLAAQIQEQVGVTVSVGLSFNKFLAKIASDLDKPAGFSVLSQDDAQRFLPKQPVNILWGVGQTLTKKLHNDGIYSVADLLPYDQKQLAHKYGSMGLHLYDLARGRDSRKVVSSRKAKSVGSETTFLTDVSSYADLRATLWQCCEKVARRLRHSETAARTVTLKLRTSSFKGLTRSKTLTNPTNSAYTLFDTALPLLEKECVSKALGGKQPAFRLLGISGQNLLPAPQSQTNQPQPSTDLFTDHTQNKRTQIEQSLDTLEAKFGPGVVKLGRGLKK